jgi:hypothetical protein
MAAYNTRIYIPQRSLAQHFRSGDIFLMLLRKGADPNKVDEDYDGNSEWKARCSVATFILEYTPLCPGDPVIMWVRARGYVLQLLRFGADVNKPGFHGETALFRGRNESRDWWDKKYVSFLSRKGGKE